MAQARTDYPDSQTVCGLMVELTSALVSMTQIQRSVTPDDIAHAREHIMAGLDLAKRLLRTQLGDVPAPSEGPADPPDAGPRHVSRVLITSRGATADAVRSDLVDDIRELTQLAIGRARVHGASLAVDVDPDLVVPATRGPR